MKVQYIHSRSDVDFNKNVNAFIKNKKVVDIKPVTFLDPNGWDNGPATQFYCDCIVVYEEEEQ